jgi:hypothetical protein
MRPVINKLEPAGHLYLDKTMRQTAISISLAILAACACNRDAEAPPSAPAARIDVSLTVLVVDEPELAKAITRIRGDWAELSGGGLTVKEASADQWTADFQPAADVVIYPARHLGELAMAERIRPLRESVLGDEALAFHEILPVVREGELAYGGKYFALPFGSRVPAIVRGGGDSHLQTLSPLGEPLAPAANFDASGAAPRETASDGFAAAWMLLALAAPLAQHPDQVDVLFDLETMEPRIAGPPFVWALEALAAANTQANPNGLDHKATWAFWPPRRSGDVSREPGGAQAAAIVQSSEVYDWNARTWEAAADGPSGVPLVGAKSTIGSVTAVSSNAPAAFRLLAWLAGPPGNGAGSVVLSPHRAGEVDELTRSALASRNFLHVPRIIQVDAYLAALDENARRALAREVLPAEALQAASAKWNEITEKVGRNLQRAAYRKHLNL